MFLLLTQILFLLLIIAVVIQLWQQSGGNNTLIVRLALLLLLALSAIAFFAPYSEVGSAVISVLSFAFKPLGLAILLLVIAATMINNKGIQQPAPTLIFLAILILVVSSTPFVAHWLVEKAEQEAIDAIRAEACCQQRGNAIVLLGYNTTHPHIPDRIAIQLTETSDRLPHTARLYREHFAPRVIVSAGPRSNLQGYVIEAVDIKNLLIYMGVKPQDILVEGKGISVRTSALATKELLDRYGLGNRVILVTSALEIRRASSVFAGVGLQVVPAPTDFYTFESVTEDHRFKRRLTGEDFFPSVHALVITTRVMEEYLAGFYYLLRGWLTPTI